MNVINTQVEPTTVWMSDHCKGAVGGCTQVARGLVDEVVGVQQQPCVEVLLLSSICGST